MGGIARRVVKSARNYLRQIRDDTRVRNHCHLIGRYCGSAQIVIIKFAIYSDCISQFIGLQRTFYNQRNYYHVRWTYRSLL